MGSAGWTKWVILAGVVTAGLGILLYTQLGRVDEIAIKLNSFALLRAAETASLLLTVVGPAGGIDGRRDLGPACAAEATADSRRIGWPSGFSADQVCGYQYARAHGDFHFCDPGDAGDGRSSFRHWRRAIFAIQAAAALRQVVEIERRRGYVFLESQERRRNQGEFGGRGRCRPAADIDRQRAYCRRK